MGQPCTVRSAGEVGVGGGEGAVGAGAGGEGGGSGRDPDAASLPSPLTLSASDGEREKRAGSDLHFQRLRLGLDVSSPERCQVRRTLGPQVSDYQAFAYWVQRRLASIGASLVIFCNESRNAL